MDLPSLKPRYNFLFWQKYTEQPHDCFRSQEPPENGRLEAGLKRCFGHTHGKRWLNHSKIKGLTSKLRVCPKIKCNRRSQAWVIPPNCWCFLTCIVGQCASPWAIKDVKHWQTSVGYFSQRHIWSGSLNLVTPQRWKSKNFFFMILIYGQAKRMSEHVCSRWMCIPYTRRRHMKGFAVTTQGTATSFDWKDLHRYRMFRHFHEAIR